MANIYDQFDNQEPEEEEENIYDQFDIKEQRDFPRNTDGSLSKNPLMWAGEFARNFGSNLVPAGQYIAEGVENLASGQTVKDLGNLAKAGGSRIMRGYAQAKGAPVGPPGPAEQPITDIIDAGQGLIEDPSQIGEFAFNRPVEAGLMLGGVSRGRLDPSTLLARGGQKLADKTSDAAMRSAMNVPRTLAADNPDFIPRVTREGVGPTMAGRNKKARIEDKVEGELNKLIKEQTDFQNRLPTTVITDNLDEMIAKLRKSRGPDTGKEITQIKKRKAEFLDEFGGSPTISANELHNWKTNTYRKAYDRAGSLDPLVSKSIETDVLRQSARGAKEALDDNIPGYKEANQRWQTMAQANKYIDNQIDRAPLDGPFKQAWRAISDHPKVKSGAAQFMRKVADGPKWEAIKWLERNFNTPEIRAILYLAGEDGTLEDSEPLQIDITNGVPQ